VSRKQGRRRKFVWRKGKIFACRFWEVKEELSDGKRTNHDMIEGSHYLVVCYVGNVACVFVKWDVSL